MFNIFDKNKNKVFITDKIIEPFVTYDINKVDVLTFEIDKENLKFFEFEGYVETKEQIYVIKDIEELQNTFKIVALQDVEEFDEYLTNKTYPTKSLDFMLNDLLPNGWKLVFKGDERKRTVTGNNINKFTLINEIIKKFEAEIRIDNKKKIVLAGYNLGEDNGSYFTDELNIKHIHFTGDSYDLVTRIIPIGRDNLGIESVNDGKAFIENFEYSNKIKTMYWEDNRYLDVHSLFNDAKKKLKELSTPNITYEVDAIDLSENLKYQFLKMNLGDKVTLINKSSQKKELFRIIKLIKYINNSFKNEITLGTKIPDLTTDEDNLRKIFNENWEKTKTFFDVVDGKIVGIIQKTISNEKELANLKTELKQTTDSIQSKIEEQVEKKVSKIEIGARNLLRNSQTFDKSKWKKWSATKIEHTAISNVESWNGYENVKLSGINTEITSNIRGYYPIDTIKFEEEKTYTISFDAINLSEFKINFSIDKVKKIPKVEVKAKENKRVALTFNKKDFSEVVIAVETELNQEPIFSIKNIKVEEGTIATTWTPAIEDLEDIDDKLKGAIEYLESDNKDLLNKFTGLALENSKIRAEISTALKQTRDEFLFQFNNYKQLLDETGKVMEQRFNDFSRYIRFKNGDIELGDVNSPFKTLLTHERISFFKNNAEVAYLSNDKLYITDAYIINSLRIGAFEIVPRSNGNLSIRKAVD